MTTDRLSPIWTLSAAERERARQIVKGDPTALLPAIEAALGKGERTRILVNRLLAEVTACDS
jgi:hypothetical protein